jgi:hypothetical protein
MFRSLQNRGVQVAAIGLLALAAARGFAQDVQPGFGDPLLGRWDITVHDSGGDYPSWLEVQLRTEHQLMGRFVGRFGSVRYVTDLQYAGNRVTFRVPVQYEQQTQDLSFEGTLEGDAIAGSTLDKDGASLTWSGVRAPSLMRRSRPRWQRPVTLFNGRDLSGWRPRDNASAACWTVEEQLLVATPPCVDLITEQTFEDFKLHVEFRYPPGSNSGVYLRGRYEVQIQDDAGKAPDPLRIGGVYGFLAPAIIAARAAGEWQTLDVTLTGRRITVVLNGAMIIDAGEIPGITGGAIDSDEDRPGPIMLQGDHGPIQFRRVRLTPLLAARRN